MARRGCGDIVGGCRIRLFAIRGPELCIFRANDCCCASIWGKRSRAGPTSKRRSTAPPQLSLILAAVQHRIRLTLHPMSNVCANGIDCALVPVCPVGRNQRPFISASAFFLLTVDRMRGPAVGCTLPDGSKRGGRNTRHVRRRMRRRRLRHSSAAIARSKRKGRRRSASSSFPVFVDRRTDAGRNSLGRHFLRWKH